LVFFANNASLLILQTSLPNDLCLCPAKPELAAMILGELARVVFSDLALSSVFRFQPICGCTPLTV
jgi:hypothetical protein